MKGPIVAGLALLFALSLACGGPRELQTAANRVRLDACGACPAPYECYLNPDADLRQLPNADPRPADVFECSEPAKEGLAAVVDRLVEPSPPRSCSASDQRIWVRNGRRFTCCLFNERVSVRCHAE